MLHGYLELEAGVRASSIHPVQQRATAASPQQCTPSRELGKKKGQIKRKKLYLKLLLLDDIRNYYEFLVVI